MPKILITILTLIAFNLTPHFAEAQKYVLDDNFEDSVYVFDIKVEKESKTENVGNAAFKLPLGDTVTVIRKLEGNEYYAVIKQDGKEYAIQSSYILFCDDNPEGVVDEYNTHAKENHTFKGKFFATLTPYMIIAVMFVIAMLFTYLGLKITKVRGIALKIVPVLIFFAALLEMLAYHTLGSSAFWWCDNDRYGFFGSLFRAVPFVAFVAFQLYSIKLYEKLLLGEDSDKKLSLLPAAISIIICVPVLIIAAAVCDCYEIGGIIDDILIIIAFVAALGIGIIFSLKKNADVLGKKNGLLFTIFSLVYILGSLIAIWGVIIVIFNLILQVLAICAALFGLSYAMGGKGGGGGSSHNLPQYQDQSGCYHSNSVDRDAADRRIDERRNNSL